MREYKTHGLVFADASALCTRTRPQTHASMRNNVRTRTCPLMRLCIQGNVLILHISAALPVHAIVSYYSPGRTVGRKGNWLSHQCRERHVGQCGSWHLTCERCQRQATATTEWVLLADLHGELGSVFVTSGKLAGWSVHVYNTHPDFERGNYGENCVLQ